MKNLLLILSFVLMFFPTRLVGADTGPKPSMEFTFSQQTMTGSLTIVSGTLYECEQSDCSDAAPLEELGPQGFSCSENSCDAVAYGFAPFHRIEIEFSDGKTRQSNIFKTAGFNSQYIVTIQPEDLLVDAKFNPELPLGPRIPPLTTAVVLLCACLLCGGVLIAALVGFLILRSTRK